MVESTTEGHLTWFAMGETGVDETEVRFPRDILLDLQLENQVEIYWKDWGEGVKKNSMCIFQSLRGSSLWLKMRVGRCG